MSTSGLFGGGAAGDAEKQKAEDFISRYHSGKPASEQESIEQLQAVARVATPQQMQAAFQASVNNLSESDRAEFSKMLQQRQAGTGMIDIERSGDRKAVESRSSDSDSAGGLGDILGQILGGGATTSTPSGGGGLGDILGQILGGGATTNTNTSSGGGGLGDILGQVLGGASGATAAPAPAETSDSGGGITDMFGDILSSPIGKAVLAGTAAYAMKEVLGK